MIPFDPFFIVCSEGTGSTLLAALLDRHSQVAVPPETFFFSDVVHAWGFRRPARSHAQLFKALMKGQAGEFDMDHAALRQSFEQGPCGMAWLLECLLKEYARHKAKPRAGEKCALHIFYLDELMAWFPRAKVLVTVRDGRDAVRYMLRPPNLSGRVSLKCCNWSMKMGLALSQKRRYPDRVMFVPFEEMVADPRAMLKKVDAFLGLAFEERQLDLAVKPGVFLRRQNPYKEKVTQAPDQSRALAWKRDMPRTLVWKMNAILGPRLKQLGYSESGLEGCPWHLRLAFHLNRAFWVPVFWVFVKLRGLVIYDRLKRPLRRRAAQRAGAKGEKGEGG